MTHEDSERFRTLSIAERFKFLDIPLHKIPFFVLDFYRVYRASLGKIFLYDGIKELLDALNQGGYQIAVISSNSEQNIREFFASNGIRCIHEVICSASLQGKDRLINDLMKRHRLQKAQAIYVGDEQRDILASRKAGIKVVWVDWGYDLLETVQGAAPDFIAHHPRVILDIVLDQVCLD
jgi:phosphoglycolate phosphatase